MPEIVPARSVRNRTPSSTALLSPVSITLGDTVPGQIVQGHERIPVPVVTLTDAGVDWRLPLSSTARLLMVATPLTVGVHLYVQLERPVAGCHVVPPSTDTSTAATTPPPASVAVPE